MVKINYIESGEKKVKEIDTKDNSMFDNVFEDIILCYPFQIENKKERTEWNDYVKENFSGLDDVYYYRYDEPFVNSDKWLKYNEDYFEDIDELIQGQKQYLKYLESIKNIINSLTNI
ncbi:MAG TPA: hypothetical protein DDW20_03560 [Firmicutes bacterium]|nr:hypothetical protein [Bacillota bacterium]